MAQWFVKDPDAKLDFMVDWESWLDGDTISSSAWLADAGITMEADPAPAHTATTATVWLSGGTGLQTYWVRNRIVTALGRENDRTLRIRVVSE